MSTKCNRKLTPKLLLHLSMMGKRGGKRTHELHPELAKLTGHIGGKRTHDTEHRKNPSYFVRQANAGRAGGKRAHELHPEIANSEYAGTELIVLTEIPQ